MAGCQFAVLPPRWIGSDDDNTGAGPSWRPDTLSRLSAVFCATVVLSGLAVSAPAHAEYLPGVETCEMEEALPAEAWLDRITTGWRPLRDGEPGRYGMADERTNAQVIYEVFREAGYSHGIAFAAIVNAWSESALDQNAIMDAPFTWNDPRRDRTKHYPRGTRAVGLFQLLPSVSGAGGPSGIAEGYSRDFQGRRYAGTRWQARRYGDTPDGLGRMYYNGQDPRINAERIVLEVDRDGDRLVAAAARGASIAELSDIFGRDIERPQSSTRYRRTLAAKMLGAELAWARNPDRLFRGKLDPADVAIAFADLQCDDELPAPPEQERFGRAHPAIQFSPLVAAMSGLSLLLVEPTAWSAELD